MTEEGRHEEYLFQRLFMHFSVKKKKIDMVHKQQEQSQEPRAMFPHGKTTAATAAYLQFLFLLLSKLCSGSVYKDGKCPILT